MAFSMSNGRKVRFWLDKWCGDEPLRSPFPSLFALATSKEAWVVDVWSPSFDGGCWAPHFSKRLNDWEVELVERFFMRLQRWRVSSDEEDRLVWVGEKCGNFFVKALYKVLENFLIAVIWNSWMPPKISFFAWEATWIKS